MTIPHEDKLYVNGMSGATGQYLVAPMTYSQAASDIGQICEYGKE